MRNNKGLSLIELIIVIAILSIISVAAISGLSTIMSWNVTKCADVIDGSLKKTKVVAMSKKDAQLRLYKSGSDYYIDAAEEPAKKIGSEPITITYSTTAGETYTIDGTTALTLAFDRSSGAFKKVDTATVDGNTVDVYCDKIIITRDSKVKTIELVHATGKHSVK